MRVFTEKEIALSQNVHIADVASPVPGAEAEEGRCCVLSAFIQEDEKNNCMKEKQERWLQVNTLEFMF